MTVDLSRYDHFVNSVTSDTSKNLDLFVNRLQDLQSDGINPALLATAATGMAGEGGEFSEIVKKLFWHGKPLTDEVKAHMMKELGDIIFYWTMACQSMNISPDDVIAANVDKLQARYPGGFSVDRSENRAEGDI